MVFFFSFKAYALDNVYFVWENTRIEIPLNDNLNDYKDKVVVKMFVNGNLSKDFVLYSEEEGTTFSTVLTNRLGTYRINYRAYSSKYHISENQNVYFIVVDRIEPIINGPNEISVLFGTEIDLKKYFVISDNYDKYEDLSISFDTRNVSFNVLGTYPATIIVGDKSTNTAKKNINIRIYDDEKPVIKLLNNLVFSYKEEINLEEFFLVTDNYDGNITDKLLLEYQDILGNVLVTAKAKDSSGNEISQKFNAKIVDDIAPEIILKDDTYFDIRKAKSVNEVVMSFVEDYYDNYDKKEDIVIKYETDLDINKVGTYEIKYQIYDKSNNIRTKTISIFLKEMIGPEIKAKDVYEFAVNTNIDYKSLVSILDVYDQNAVNNLIISKNETDVNSEGLYSVVYECINSSGQKATKTVNIKIISDQNSDILTYIKDNMLVILIVGIEAIIIISLGFFLIRKKHSQKN